MEVPVEFRGLEPRPSWRERVGQGLVPALAIVGFSAAAAAVAMGFVETFASMALVPILAASVAGAFFALLMILRSRPVEAPDYQAVDRHPGWLRYGPVGGVGGLIGILGFVTIALLRAPIFVPVTVVSVVLGGIGAVILYKVRARAFAVPALPKVIQLACGARSRPTTDWSWRGPR
jgi:hypothetical protein